MPASALLKFTQGATVGGDGRALVGVLTTSVALANVNNSGVQSWQIDLVYVDPTSSLTITTAYAFNDASSTPAANFTPDVRRSYRWVLKVWDVPNRVGDPTNVDIRVFSVRELNGVLIPPSQVWPPPLPDTRSGELTAKPNEMNFDGQLEGWHGTGLDGLLNQLLAKHMPPVPGNPGDVLTVSSGRWTSLPPSGGGAGDVSGPGAAVVADNIVIWDGTSGTDIKDSGFGIAAFIKKDGTVAFTGNQSMGGFKLTSVANGTVAGDAVNFGQLQAAINGLDPKGNVRALSTTNVTLSGLGAFGGLGSLNDGDRAGLSGQTDPKENGIWVAHSGAWTRPSDFNTGMDVSGAYFIVEEGTSADREFLITSDTGSAVVGTNNLTVQDFGSSTISAGNGLQKVGNVISVLLDGSTLAASGSGLKIATDGITSNEMGTGSVDLASNTVTGLLPFANIANGSATSVLGRSAGTSGVMASIAASADGQTLRMAAGALGFGALDLADADAVTGLLPFANLANLAGLSVLGRSTNSSGVMAAITGTADQVLAVNTAGTALAFSQVQTGGIANSAVTLAKLANATAASVLGRSANTTGVYADIASSADGQVMRRAGGTLAFGAVDLADTDAVTGLLPFANIANGSANSVLGRAAGTSGVMASIAASADGQTLRLAAGTLGFGALDLADADAVTGLLPFANIASLAGLSVLGRSANTTGVMAAITGTDGQVLRVSGTTLGFGTIATAGLAANSVDMTILADLAGNSVIGRAANTTGDPAAITAGTAGQILRLSGTTLGFGALDLADADAVTNQLPGSFVVPDFVAQTVITTGSYRSGTTPATTGAYNVPNNTTAVMGRNAANSADKIMLRIDSSDTVSVGDVAATGIRMTTAGVIGFRIAGADAMTLQATLLEMAFATLQFDVAVVSPTIFQESDSTTAVTADALSINAQDATGTGATVGGILNVRAGNSTNGTGGLLDLRSGSGSTATTAGDMQIRIGGTVFFRYPGTVVPAASGILRVHHNASALVGRNNANSQDVALLRWGTTTDTLILGTTTAGFNTSLFGDAIAISGVGNTTISVNGTPVVTVTSTLVTSAQPVAQGTTPATTGNLRLPNGGTVNFRNAANSANILVLSVDGSDQVIFGDPAAAAVYTAGGTNVLIRPAGTDRVQITDTVFEWRMSTVRFDVAVVNPAIIQEVDATNGVSGDTLTITGQDVTGTGSTVGGPLNLRAGNSTNNVGGSFDVRSGAGASATQAGAFNMRIGATVFLAWSGTAAVASQGAIRFASATGIFSRNNANSADLQIFITNGSDGITYGDTTVVQAISINTVGARMIFGTNIEIQNSSQFRFDNAVASPQIIQEDDTTAAVTGDMFLFQAQSVTGTGATVGGIGSLRGGNSTNGTGGGVELRSGTGATATTSGDVSMRIGSAIIFSYPGTVIPANVGILRPHHNASVIYGRNNANSLDLAIIRWGVIANDKLTVGNSTGDTELLGNNVEIGDGSVYIEVAVLATNREIVSLLLGAALTTTEMPTNTGDKVVYLANATTAPTANSTGGLIMYSASGAFVTRDTAGVMTLGDGTIDLSYKATNANGHRWYVAGTLSMQYVGSSQGLIFHDTHDSIVVGGPGAGLVMYFETPDSSNANVAFFSPPTFSGKKIIFIGNRNTAPSANPSSGGFLFAESGALFWRGSSGAVTQLASA